MATIINLEYKIFKILYFHFLLTVKKEIFLLCCIMILDINYSDVNNSYNTNIKEKIRKLELQQILNLENKRNDLSLLSSFDELKFDMHDLPFSSENVIDKKSIKDINLQRDIDLKNGYSDAVGLDMTYGTQPCHSFNKNITPFTSRRSLSIQSNSNVVELFTGTLDLPHKSEIKSFSQPFINPNTLIPPVSSLITNRFLPSNKNNNGNLPFASKIKTAPGINNLTQNSSYAVYRLLPKNIDELRAYDNKKISYNNKPLETYKKGELRAPFSLNTKFKRQNIKETKYDDLIPSSHEITKPKMIGEYTDLATQRNEKENYIIKPAFNNLKGTPPNINKIKFTPSAKIVLNIDSERNISGLKSDFIINKKSYNILNNNRNTTKTLDIVNINSNNKIYLGHYNAIEPTVREKLLRSDPVININPQDQGHYFISKDFLIEPTKRQINNSIDITNLVSKNEGNKIYNSDLAKKTLRPEISHSVVLNPSAHTDNVPLYNNDPARKTLRPEISHSVVLNPSTQTDNVPLYNNDPAKLTMRENSKPDNSSITNNNVKLSYIQSQDKAKLTNRTLYEVNNYDGVLANCIKHEQYIQQDQKARPTIKEETELNNYISNANNENNLSYIYSKDHICRPTIKEISLYSTPHINLHDIDNSTYMLSKDNIARKTIKEDTLLEDYTGICYGKIDDKISHLSASNMTIDDKKEKSLVINHKPNGSKDLVGPVIDKNNVQLREYNTFIYVSHPQVGLNYSVVPDRHKIMESDNSDNYRINNDFISELKNNPYVNNIYHSKS